MAGGIFITATGTDIGKTYISGLLVKKIKDLGMNCGYYKPALSGAAREGDKLILGDCEFVKKLSGLAINPDECVTYYFEEAVSPHLAAERQNISIELEPIKYDFEKLKTQFKYLVVEGAGGITCPFNLGEKQILLPDVIKALGLGIVIVADGGLGTINSVLLTVEYARSHSLNIKGIILNNFEPNNFMHIDNRTQIEKLTGIEVLATVSKDEKDLNIQTDKLLKIFNEG